MVADVVRKYKLFPAYAGVIPRNVLTPVFP